MPTAIERTEIDSAASDFNRIIEAGLADDSPLLPRTDSAVVDPFVRDERVPFIFDEARERVSAIVSCVVRDRVFRRIVLRTYDERCAVTGLKLINSGGRAEVEAAHIRPVEADGLTLSAMGSRFPAPHIGCLTVA